MGKQTVYGFVDYRGEIGSIPTAIFQNARMKAVRLGFGFGNQMDGKAMVVAPESYGAVVMDEGITGFQVPGDGRSRFQVAIASYPCRIRFANGFEVEYNDRGGLVYAGAGSTPVRRKSASMAM